ncbi:hypothetical protein KIW84_042243 [Lathyrus oleraceus]|uniref:Uncharacterized protein n=1 Tax=Pisum sativum TaxID=3888 RepID=A0A9D4XCH9_PEA|nr:hypothetical protein KIW84_042243 [Pisum sativum]
MTMVSIVKRERTWKQPRLEWDVAPPPFPHVPRNIAVAGYEKCSQQSRNTELAANEDITAMPNGSQCNSNITHLAHFGVVSVSEKLFVIGGGSDVVDPSTGDHNDCFATDEVWSYDPVIQQWSPQASMLVPCSMNGDWWKDTWHKDMSMVQVLDNAGVSLDQTDVGLPFDFMPKLGDPAKRHYIRNQKQHRNRHFLSSHSARSITETEKSIFPHWKVGLVELNQHSKPVARNLGRGVQTQKVQIPEVAASAKSFHRTPEVLRGIFAFASRGLKSLTSFIPNSSTTDVREKSQNQDGK